MKKFYSTILIMFLIFGFAINTIRADDETDAQVKLDMLFNEIPNHETRYNTLSALYDSEKPKYNAYFAAKDAAKAAMNDGDYNVYLAFLASVDNDLNSVSNRMGAMLTRYYQANLSYTEAYTRFNQKDYKNSIVYSDNGLEHMWWDKSNYDFGLISATGASSVNVLIKKMLDDNKVKY